MTPQPVTVPSSELHVMDSVSTGSKYRITVSLPYAYGKSGEIVGPFDTSPDKWPVVYLLDANWYFAMVTDIVRSMAWCLGTSDAIVVGIGYPEQDDLIETWLEAFARRNFDFTWVQSHARETEMQEWLMRPVQTGGAGQFHQFIRNELFPFIEDNYQADPDRRSLIGHSLGGDFAAFALFEEPALFDAFVILSCAPADGDRNTIMREEAFLGKHTALPTKVFFGVGELEETSEVARVSDTLRLHTQMIGRHYEGLTLAKQVFEGLNHCEVIAPGLQAGLKFALKH